MSEQAFKDYKSEIVKKLRIEDVIGEYLQINQIGSRFRAVCPFHADKDPSFYISPDRGTWKCFGCNAKGSLFDFIMKIENMSFIDSFHFLAEKAGITIELNEKQSAEYHRRKSITAIIKESSKFYHEQLFKDSGKLALNYLKARGITEETAKRFGLGYAPIGSNNLSYYLDKKSFNKELVLQSGMSKISKSGQHNDVFQNRLTIPILDHMGNFIAMGGRYLGQEDSVPKYLNTTYRKGEHFFGLNLSKQEIKKTNAAILVEGYFDLIALWQYDVKNVVASLGTALTEKQASLLRQFCSEVILTFDADGAGGKASAEGVGIFLSAGMTPKVAEIPKGNDPDTFIRANGKPVFQKTIKNSLGFFEYHIKTQKKLNDLSTPLGKSNFAKEIMPIIEKLKDHVIIAEYIKKISEEAGISESVLRQMLKRRNYHYNSSSFDKETKVMSAEEKILAVVFQYPSLINKVSDSISLSDIEDDILRKIYEILFSIEPKEKLSAQDFAIYADEAGLNNEIMELVMSENLQVTSESIASELIEELLEKIKDSKLLSRLKGLKKEVEEAIMRNEIAHDDLRFIEYQRLLLHFKGRK